METKTQKSALNETIKAEERKVMEDQPTTTKKVKKLNPRMPMPAAKSTAKSASNVRPKKTETNKKSEKEKRKPKIKVIRDSFSMPEKEYSMIATLKKQCLASGITVKKSELLRAGLKALSDMSPASLNRHLSELPAIKTGRPVKAKEDK